MAAGCKFFSSVDTRNAYYMISVTPANSDKRLRLLLLTFATTTCPMVWRAVVRIFNTA